VDVDPKFATQVITVAKVIDQLDYYKILSVKPDSTLSQIREAYHKQTRIFHPDRYFHVQDEEFKQGIYVISKRVTEAYVTLRDAQKRRFYDQQLAETSGAKLRYDEESAQQHKQAKVEETGKTEQGRKMYQQGLREMKSKNFVAAERSFKMALAYESDNELFKQMAEEAARNIKVDYKVK
jgi:curved DNA-binding protein CbpA